MKIILIAFPQKNCISYLNLVIKIFRNTDNQTEITVQFDEDTVWLNQQQLSELFDRDITVISRPINNIFKEQELEKKVGSAKFAHATQHGALKGKTQLKDTEYYNLDVIISVGYRINSKRGIQFRHGATQHIKD